MKYFLYFLEIARAKNLSRAAERLYVSQSALSQFLAREEAELGVKLFLRRHNTLLLTPAGQRYFEACQDILDRKNCLYQELASLETCKVGSMAVGITPQWGCEMFSCIYPIFQRDYPNYTLKLFEDTTFPLMAMVRQKELDLAILAFNRMDGIPLRCEAICEERFVLAAPRGAAPGSPWRAWGSSPPAGSSSPAGAPPSARSRTKCSPQTASSPASCARSTTSTPPCAL